MINIRINALLDSFSIKKISLKVKLCSYEYKKY